MAEKPAGIAFTGQFDGIKLDSIVQNADGNVPMPMPKAEVGGSVVGNATGVQSFAGNTKMKYEAEEIELEFIDDTHKIVAELLKKVAAPKPGNGTMMKFVNGEKVLEATYGQVRVLGIDPTPYGGKVKLSVVAVIK
ncbi:hypothetical protein ACODT3_41990 [Streptomyces sp. 4.24]|uniref:hypothetical protein n=1 Tax=Streptomyces tritrimontium TaxID=3406573 RepID=UPI003BB68F1B